MGYKDLLLGLIFFGLYPLAFLRPLVAAVVFVVLGIATPYTIAYGFAADFPWAMLYAVPLLVGALRAPKGAIIEVFSATRLVWLFYGFTCLTTLLAMDPEVSSYRLLEFGKVLVGVTLVSIVARDLKSMKAVFGALAVSIGYYGLKGSVFTLSGSPGRVFGPPNTLIEDNNHLAVALVVAVPILYWIATEYRSRLVRLPAYVIAATSSISVLGTYSRGGFLALLAMLSLFYLRARQKALVAVIVLFTCAVALFAMPDRFWDRLSTIQTYNDDSSARSRLDLWETAIQVALHRPLGAGYEYYKNPANFFRYSDISDGISRATHSVYFQALGEHGILGLMLFLAMLASAYRSLSRTARSSPGIEKDNPAGTLASMLQVSLLSFCVGAIFLSLTYWEGLYYLIFGARLLERRFARAAPVVAMKLQQI